MNRYFDFKIQYGKLTDGDKPNYGLVIFIPPIDFSENEFESYISSIPWKRRTIDKLYLLVSNINYLAVKDFVCNNIVTERLPIHFRSDFKECVIFLRYNHSGKIDMDINGKYHLINTHLRKNIFESGLLEIFDNGNSILEYSNSHHYVLQSGKHTDRFIRAANALEHGSRVDFIALTILEYVKDNIKAIYCDSSSISSLAYAIIKLKILLLDEKKVFLPYVDSFKSYSGLSKKNFSFLHKDDCLVIISASTTGELSLGLVEKRGIPENNILTLFYLNKDKKLSRGNLLCNLSNKSYYKPFVIYEEAECKFCKLQSVPIKITGEQFIPEENIISQIEFELRNLPNWFRPFMSQFHSKKLISCHYGNTSEQVREIYLNLEQVLSGIEKEFKLVSNKKKNYIEFQKKFQKKIDHYIPMSTNRIIHMPDNSSILMSKIIKQYLVFKYGIDNKKIDFLNYKEFSEHPEKFIKNNGTTVVVASSVATGRKLLTTSLLLRKDKSAILYLVGVLRMKDKDAMERIEKYIGFDNYFGAKTNPIHFIESIHIPDDSITYSYNTFQKRKVSSWNDEIDLMLEIIKFVKKNRLGIRLEAIFDARLNELKIARTRTTPHKGLVDTLFWNSSNNINEPLKLRDNFAFFKGVKFEPNEIDLVSQADVYFTISTIFHNLRSTQSGLAANDKIIQSEHHRSIISPKNFHCFNDGIIQASILRSAHSDELNYIVSGENIGLADEIKNVLEPIFKNWNKPVGEATIEFLICIAMNRLQISNSILSDLIDKLKESANKSKLIVCLCDFITFKIIDNGIKP